MKFYKCKKSNELLISLNQGTNTIYDGDDTLVEVEPNQTEASVEKHKPIFLEEDGRTYVVVGSALHPSTIEHFIEWILVEYKNHYNVYHIGPAEEPKVKLCKHETPLAAYAFCNLHGLWKND